MSNHDITTNAIELATAATTIAAGLCHQVSDSPPKRLPDHLQDALGTIKNKSTQLMASFEQPSEFLGRLAIHVQLLASLQWLCEFQILACIPPDAAVPYEDVADISGVPEEQLRRITRLMAAAGFLCEQASGRKVAHTPLSAQFVSQPAFLDAALFISSTAAPAALKMAKATREFGAPDQRPASQSAYSLTVKTPTPLIRSLEAEPKLQRQFDTYLRHGSCDDDEGLHDVLMRQDWIGLDPGVVVFAGARSTRTAYAVASLCPRAKVFVQTYEDRGPQACSLPGESQVSSLLHTRQGSHSSHTLFSGSAVPPVYPLATETAGAKPDNVFLQKRTVGAPQTIPNHHHHHHQHGGAISPAKGTPVVFVLHAPPPSLLQSWAAVAADMTRELRVHLPLLRNQSQDQSVPGNRLILTALVLPDSEVSTPLDADAELSVRTRDLCLAQLANITQPERSQLEDLVAVVRDSHGRLVLGEETHSSRTSVAVFEVRYQAVRDGSL